MQINFQYVPLDKIELIYNLKTSVAYLKRMKSTNDLLLEYDLLLPVEKHPTEDKYILVGGYDKYKHLLSIGSTTALCIIECYSSTRSDQLTKLIRRLINSGDSTKENKQSILSLLYKLNEPLMNILNKTGITSSEFKGNYVYRADIPNQYINKYTTEKTMNWIASLTLSEETKAFLYKSAGLPKNTTERLTQDKIEIIGDFIKQEPRFTKLEPNQQIKVLSCAINYKANVINSLRSLVTELINERLN